MNILFIGDIVGNPGRNAVKIILPRLKERYCLDFVVANAENSSGGSGITPKCATELFSCGVDVLTSGDHVFKRRELFDILAVEKRVLRPANFPPSAPGSGAEVFTTHKGLKVGIVNLLGRVFLSSLDCPFAAADKLVSEISKETPIIIVDMHAEATSEKIALGRFLDGRVSAVLGTHTHVQTADEQIFPNGTAFISDAGFCGAFESVLGRNIEDVLERFKTQMPVHFRVAENDVQLHGVVLDIDDASGKAKNILRIQERL